MRNPFYFFCVKNESGKYSSIVEYRKDDLIWYTLPEYRGTKVLSTALKEGVLKLAVKKGWNGMITISKGSEFENSRHLAIALGFKKVESENPAVDFYKFETHEFKKRWE